LMLACLVPFWIGRKRLPQSITTETPPEPT
jgi:hypothetical protein